MRKPQVKAGGMAPKKPGRALATPGGGSSMGMPAGMPGMGQPGMKGGGIAKKAAAKGGAKVKSVDRTKKMAGDEDFKKGGAVESCMKGGGLAAKATRTAKLKKKMKK